MPPTGDCYRQAYDLLMELHRDGDHDIHLVHGWVTNPNGRFVHAWVETQDGAFVIEATAPDGDGVFDSDHFYGSLSVEGVVRAIIEAICGDPEWKNVSQEKIAAHVGVSKSYVNEIKTGRYQSKLDKQRDKSTDEVRNTSVTNTSRTSKESEKTEAGGSRRRVTTEGAQEPARDDVEDRELDEGGGDSGGGGASVAWSFR